MAEKTARFNIDFTGNAAEVSDETAASLEKVREAIVGSLDRIRQMNGSLRALRGSTEEVKDAKAELQAAIEAEKAAVSAANLKLLDQGVTYEKLASKANELAKSKEKLDAKMRAKDDEQAKERASALKNAISAAGGPVESLAGKFDSLKGIVGGAGAAMAGAALAVAAAVAAIVALGAAIVGATVAFTKFVIESGNASRTMQLFREAAAGSAVDATHLGNQVERLAHLVPTSRDELNKLAIATTQSLSGTRVSGQGIVDTFNAVAQASSAMGDQVGAQLKGIIERGKNVGRIGIASPFELQGTGLKVQDIAAELAKNLGVSVQAAQTALFQGRVKIDDGAKAIRQAVEKRFGEINARRLLDVGVQFDKFKEKLGALVKDINLEPLLKTIEALFAKFDASTSTGATLKKIADVLGNDIIGTLVKGGPAAGDFFDRLVGYALDGLIAFYKLRNGIRDTWRSSALLRDAVGLLGDGLKTMATITGVAVVALAAITAAAIAIPVAIAGIPSVLVGFGTKLFAAIKGWATQAKDAAGEFIAGLVDGIRERARHVVDEVKNLGKSIMGAFTGKLEIHSPSRVFARYGAETAEGYAQGLEGGTDRAQGAALDLAPRGPGRGVLPGGAGGGTVFQVQINIPPGATPETVKQARESFDGPDFRTLLTNAFEAFNLGQGIPSQQGAPA